LYDSLQFQGFSYRKLSHNFPSFHIRRTDKVYESPDSVHSIKAYFEELKNFENVNEISALEVDQLVFIASDDHTVLEEARRK
jgi:hypothetical protein